MPTEAPSGDRRSDQISGHVAARARPTAATAASSHRPACNAARPRWQKLLIVLAQLVLGGACYANLAVDDNEASSPKPAAVLSRTGFDGDVETWEQHQ